MQNKNGVVKKIVAVCAAATIAAMAVLPAAAATATDTGTGSVTSSVAVNGTISPLTISVTHPVNASYAIDPNAGTFTSPAVAVTNNTKVPVNVTVQSLSSASGGSIQFQDVMPDSKTWSALSNADSKKYIAVGVSAANSTGWAAGYNASTDWAASGTPALIGSLPSGASGSLSLTADYGYAFDQAYTSAHNLVFMFTLS